MIDTIVRWLGAGDQAFLSMGPILSIVLAMVGGFGITQVVKFLLVKVVSDDWRDWTIRSFGIGATWFVAHYIGNLSWPVEMVTAFAQPFAYKGLMAAIRHYWPWMEAGKVLGSAAPSPASVELRAARKAGP